VDCNLTNKLAFNFMLGQSQEVPWHKLLWNTYIPPSMAFISWRFLHNKLPTEDNLKKRGCIIVSICCFCKKSEESSLHLFLRCAIIGQLWLWLMKGTDQILDLSSINSLLLRSTVINSKMVKYLMDSAIVHIIWSIWIERNNRCFSNKYCSIKVARLFGIALKTRRLTHIQEVSWTPRHSGCIKLNCDGSSFGSPPCGSIGVVLRNSSSVFLGAFAQNIGYATPLEAEFSACMLELEKAASLHLQNVWVETDSLRVVKAFNKQDGVPWRIDKCSKVTYFMC